MSTGPVYDTIGRGYARQRRSDPRIAAQLSAALGGARSVLNVGAGAGSYEPPDRRRRPRAVGGHARPAAAERGPAVRGRAEALPFPDQTFDATMAVLTLHHWADRAGGLAECARVARASRADVGSRVRRILAGAGVPPRLHRSGPAPVPWHRGLRRGVRPGRPGSSDGSASPRLRRRLPRRVLGAAGAYLDPAVRAGISSFARPDTETGLERLRADLASGAWHTRHGPLLAEDALDVGYRLVVADLPDRTAEKWGRTHWVTPLRSRSRLVPSPAARPRWRRRRSSSSASSPRRHALPRPHRPPWHR